MVGNPGKWAARSMPPAAPENALSRYGRKVRTALWWPATIRPDGAAARMKLRALAHRCRPATPGPDMFGGCYLTEAASLDEAIKWAARVPASWRGKIELRPVVQMSNKPG